MEEGWSFFEHMDSDFLSAISQSPTIKMDDFVSRWKSKGWTAPAVNHDEERDFIGYGREVPNISWPGGKKVAVSFVLNFEEGAEFTIGDGDKVNEGIYEVIDREDGVRDFCIESHFEYGTRVGYWRLVDTFGRYNTKITVSACGRAAERAPWLVKDAAQRGHEIAGHGYRWETHAKMSEEKEADSINKTVESIRKVTGKPPVGWHTRSERSPSTRKLLIERGFIYSDDAYNDDTPYFVKVNDHLHLILPYTFDTNDMQFQNTNRFNTASSFAEYVIESFDWLCQRESNIPRMMTIGLHLRVITRPGRMPALERILDHITKSGKAWITSREDIARHWLKMTYETPDNSEDFSTLNTSKLFVRTNPFKLLILNPTTSHTTTKLLVSHVRSIVPSSVSLITVTSQIGDSVINSESAYVRGSYGALEALRNHLDADKSSKPDAILVGCIGDTGVWAIRDYLSEINLKIPVLGLGEASMRQAVERCSKFAIVAAGSAWGVILTRLAKSLDLYNFVAGIHTIADVAKFTADRPMAVSLVLETTRQAIIAANGKAVSSCDKIGSVILGGPLLAGISDDLDINHVNIIDSVSAGVQMLVKAMNSEVFFNVIK